MGKLIKKAMFDAMIKPIRALLIGSEKTINFEKITNVVVLRSLSKTAGLAGLRIGFAIGNKKIINYLTRVTGPYDVNSFAVTAAIAALKLAISSPMFPSSDWR